MKKILWIVSILCLLITILVFTDTYGLFETNASATSNLSIGKWKIKINGNDVSLSEVITLSDFVFSSNQHVDDGYFAPGRNAQFEVEMDMSESDVSVEYALEIDDTQIQEYPNIYFSIMDTDTNEVIYSNTCNGIVLLNSSNRVKKLKIFINWDNQTEYDESDTSTIGKNLEFIINANFKQYIGE